MSHFVCHDVAENLGEVGIRVSTEFLSAIPEDIGIAAASVRGEPGDPEGGIAGCAGHMRRDPQDQIARSIGFIAVLIWGGAASVNAVDPDNINSGAEKNLRGPLFG